MKRVFVAILAVLLLAACTSPSSPAASSAPASSAAGQQQVIVGAPAPETPAPAPESQGISGRIGGPASQPGIQPTGVTRNYVFSVDRSGYNPSILTITPGDREKFTISNDDTKDHSFIISELSLNTVISAGNTVTIDFTPLTQGEFTWTERDGSKAGTLIIEYKS
jgi:plastocyanin